MLQFAIFPSTKMLEFFFRATFSRRSQRASLISVIPQSFCYYSCIFIIITLHLYRAWLESFTEWLRGRARASESESARERMKENASKRMAHIEQKKLFKHKCNNRTNYKTNRIKRVWTKSEIKLLRKINDGIEKIDIEMYQIAFACYNYV